MCKERLEVVTPGSRSCITADFREPLRTRLSIFFLRSGKKIIRNTKQVGVDTVAAGDIREKTRFGGMERRDKPYVTM